jgi:hypothetical protein
MRDVEHSPHFLIIDSVDLTNARKAWAKLALDIARLDDLPRPRLQGSGGAS